MRERESCHTGRMGFVAVASTVTVFSIIIVIICAAGGRTGLLMIYVLAVHRNDIVSAHAREQAG